MQHFSRRTAQLSDIYSSRHTQAHSIQVAAKWRRVRYTRCAIVRNKFVRKVDHYHDTRRRSVLKTSAEMRYGLRDRTPVRRKYGPPKRKRNARYREWASNEDACLEIASFTYRSPSPVYIWNICVAGELRVAWSPVSSAGKLTELEKDLVLYTDSIWTCKLF